MNEMDLLSRMRDEVPLGVSPRAEHLFRTALLESDNPDLAATPSRHSGWRQARQVGGAGGARVAWRPVLVASLAAAVAAAVIVTVLPSRGQAPAGRPVASGPSVSGRASAVQPSSVQPTSPVKLLADRAATAALARPNVRPGQWVYRETETSGTDGKSEKKGSEELWATADDKTEASYYNGKLGIYHRDRNNNGAMGALDFFPVPLTYSSLPSLPAQPAALVKRLAEIGVRAHTGEPVGCSLSTASCTTFLAISELLSSYVMPPALTAEIYRALGDIPGVSVVPHVDVASQPGTGFRIPLKGGYLVLIINSATYQYMATQGSFPGGVQGSNGVARQALVSGPGVRP